MTIITPLTTLMSRGGTFYQRLECIPTQGALAAGMWVLEAGPFNKISVDWAVQSLEDLDCKGTFTKLRKHTA